jgi:hypothetical protein
MSSTALLKSVPETMEARARGRIIGLGWVLAATLLLLAARQSAEAKTVNVKSTFSGTSTSTAFSFNGSDLAGQGVVAGRMAPGGPFTGNDVSQSAPNGKTCTLPGGTPNAGTEFTLVGSSGVSRDDASGDLTYWHDISSTDCIDFSSGTPPFPFVGSNSQVIDGGTGKNAGASGTMTNNFSGVILSLPSSGFGVFLAFSGTGTGTLTTP